MSSHGLPVSLLKYGTPYAQDDPLLPPVGTPSDFIAPSFLARPRWRHLQDAEARMRADPFPIPAVVNREGYCNGVLEIDGEAVENHIGYWLSGYTDYLTTTEAAARHGCTGGRVFEFGGGTGRVFRHFAAQGAGAWDTWTSDFRLSSVRWNLMHFSPHVKALSNTSTPTLPLPDGYFDLVAAYSVFTHIDEPELQWLAELRRILKVGGLAFLTIHNEDTWRSSPSWRERFAEHGIAPDGDLPPWKTVSTWREDDPYNCNVFHGRDYIERVWGSLFEIVEITPHAVGDQAAVLCRRPN